MSFLIEYIKHPRRIGAIAPSGKCLSRQMMKPIDFSSSDVIVEYGPGTGSFTKELVTNRRAGTVLILIEQNEYFYKRLEDKFGGQPDLHIVYGNAENVNEYLKEYGFQSADYIVSGLPFTSLPKNVSGSILTATNQALGKNGKFITFQYSLIKCRFFEQYFRITRYLREMKNLPPAYVLVMKNQCKEIDYAE